MRSYLLCISNALSSYLYNGIIALSKTIENGLPLVKHKKENTTMTSRPLKTLIELLNIKQCNNLKLSKVIGVYTYDSSDIKYSKYGKKNETNFKIFDNK